MSKLGLLGGTFDPPHIGHLILAQAAYDELKLDRVIFIPAAKQPHKQRKMISSPEVRLEMLMLALKGDGRFELSDIELTRPGFSYTYETITALKKVYAQSELFLIIGGDNIAEIETWEKPEAIFDMVKVAAALRPQCQQSGRFKDRITIFDMPQVDISSTLIRNFVKHRRPIKYLVSANVESYIRSKKLYL